MSLVTGITINMNEYQAARLLQLVKDGEEILDQQFRDQRGYDGYTRGDLYDLKEVLQTCTRAVTFRPNVTPIKLKLKESPI